mmetsp:Transcript_24660/g.56919  ORF Transcript_24660/g.56919 Transcript_24660/m.56919 type:complete len:100 (-) Transcript_24660:8-307(-)
MVHEKAASHQRYPVIDPNPSIGAVIRNMDSGDWGRFAAITAVSLPFGFAVGGNIRRPTMIFAGIVGAIGGMAIGFQGSAHRLLGLAPNDREVARMKQSA